MNLNPFLLLPLGVYRLLETTPYMKTTFLLHPIVPPKAWLYFPPFPNYPPLPQALLDLIPPYKRTSIGIYSIVSLKDNPPTVEGAGGIIFTSESNSFSFATKLGSTTNNHTELMALKLTLPLEKEKGNTQLHIYGDSRLVINWMTGKNTLNNYTLWPLYTNIMRLTSSFSYIDYSHVYRQQN
jgi:ribonuclease HI